MIHIIRISYFTLLGYFLLCNISINENGAWWKQEVMFSDWRNVKVDYSTNAIVDWRYNGKGSKYLRLEFIPEISKRLEKGDTLTIGIDYYGLSISSPFIPTPLLQKYGNDIMNGKVITVKVYRNKNIDNWITQ